MQNLRFDSKLFLVALLVFSISFGCSSKDDDDNPLAPAQPQPPGFTISSINVALQGGTEGIQFFGRANKDVSVIRVDVIDPLNQKTVYNVGGGVFLSAEIIAFQDTNFGYFKASGQWSFRIVGNAEPSKETFDVTINFNVSS